MYKRTRFNVLYHNIAPTVHTGLLLFYKLLDVNEKDIDNLSCFYVFFLSETQ